jgi:SagB-type dehydrogenase family enzyme
MWWQIIGCEETPKEEKITMLPEPITKSDISLEETLQERRSIRSYREEPLSLAEISQLLWAAQGVTNEKGFRTAPTAGALFPVEIYVAIGEVENLEAGIYKYQIGEHKLQKISDGDARKKLANAAWGQNSVRDGAAVFVLSAVYERVTQKYGERGRRYVHMELGHVSQNLYLQATALDLRTVAIGAFDDDQVKKVMQLESQEEPLYIMPFGNKK